MPKVSLGSIAYIEMGQSPQSISVNQSGIGIPFLQGNGEFSAKHPKHKNWCISPIKTSNSGDVLLSVRAPVGETNISDRKYCIGRGLAAIRFRSIDSGFGWYALNYFSRDLQRVAQGTTFQAIGSKDLNELKLLIPSRSQEQRRIANILEELDLQISFAQFQIAKYRNILDGVIVSQLLEYYDYKRPTSIRIGKLKGQWRVAKLSEVALVERGKFTHRPRNDPRCYGGKFPFIQTGDVGAANGATLHSFTQTLSEFGRTVSKEFPVGTIALTIAANIGDTCLLGIPMCFPDSVVGIQVDRTKLLPEFMQTFLHLHKSFFESRAPQSAQKNINLQDLMPLPVPIPSLEDQQRFVGMQLLLRDKIASLDDALKKHQRIKDGLLDFLIGGISA